MPPPVDDPDLPAGVDEPGEDLAVTGAGTPAVVVVVPVADADESFAETLAGVADQDYSNLTVMVLQTSEGSAVAEMVADAIPTAFVRRVGSAPSFGATCNDVLGSVEGATFLLFLHDHDHHYQLPLN